MTAEVAILNKSAVALAADSAVTIQYGKDVKIYNTLKLFSLCQSNSIGIMIYHNAEFTGVPWETIIKQYRKEGRSFPTLEEYGNDFIAYLTNNRLLFPDEAQKVTTTRAKTGYLKLLASAMDEAIKASTRNGKIGAARIKKITRDAISSWHDGLRGQQQWASLPADAETQILKDRSAEIDAIVDSVFQPLPLNQQLRKKLRFIATWLITKDLRKLSLPQGYSGVVIAGFGENDIYPAVTTYNVESLVNNELRFEHIDEKSERIRPDMGTRVIAFAQEEVVAGFMEGMDPELTQGMFDLLSRMIVEYANDVGKKVPSLRGKSKQKWVNDVKTLGFNKLQVFADDVVKLKQKRHIQPIIRAVSGLPKEELASMAEALVNLTSTKRRVTMELETVGGPIDVAVISKGDGFIWIKRKHYFDGDKNPQFFTKFH